ncbi:hypothetical protein Tco_1184280 [Tanacetum coccineum]
MSKSAWTEKDQIDNFLKERRLMRSLEKGEAKTTSPTTQAQVTCVSESVSYSKFDAKTFKVNEELRKGRWWEIVRRRPTAATKDHMISSYDVLIIQVDPHRFEGTNKDGNGDFRYSDTVRPSSSDEVLNLKKFEKDASFKLSNQERYEHVGPKVRSFTRWQRLQDGEKRLCLVDDLLVLKITYLHTS